MVHIIVDQIIVSIKHNDKHSNIISTEIELIRITIMCFIGKLNQSSIINKLVHDKI